MLEEEESWEQEYEEEEEEEEEEGASRSAREEDRRTEDSYSTLAVGYRPSSRQGGRMSAGSISPPQRTSTPLATRPTASRNRRRPRTSTPPPRPPSPPQPHYDRSSSSLSYSSTPNYPPPSSQYSQPLPATPLHLHTPTPHRLSPSIPAFLLSEPTSHQPPTKHHLPRKDPLQHSNLNAPRSSSPPIKPSRTPRAQALPPSPAKGAKVPKLVSESRALIEAELQREDEERERRREDERRGDRFYELGLLGRCWDVWRRGREWVMVSSSSSPLQSVDSADVVSFRLLLRYFPF